MKLLISGFVLASILLIIGSCGFYFYKCKISEPEWVIRRADRGEVRQIVSATGSLAASNTVEVGCQISGIIASICVDFNDRVIAGQQIAMLDPVVFDAQLEQARANLEGARADESNLKSKLARQSGGFEISKGEVQIQQASLKKAEISLEISKRNLKRIEGMFQKHMVSESDFDDAKSNVRLNEAQLEACFAQIKIAEIKQKSTELERESVLAELDGAIARINQMEALFKVAQINLKNTRICSPIEGIVISRKVSVGQTVAASLQAPTLFTIANDLRRMQIEALIDESDICKIKTGQIATFSVDAFPNRKFQGSVSQVRLAPTTQNVVMYTVIINVNNEDLALKPGITAKIEILVEERQDVLRIPTQVLFFIPPPEILARFPTSIQENEETETSLVWVQSSASGIYPLEIHTGVSNAIYTEVMNEPFASGACLVARVKEWWTDWFGL